jgi:diguanylate cyclase (GGDEF)-like protein
MLQSTYYYPLVLASFLVASFASYTTLDLAGRISTLGPSRTRFAWLAGGATAMGIGIWSMHFIGMLAFSLPISLGYDFSLTFYSLVIAVLVSWFALDLVSRGALSTSKLLWSGTLLGGGIASMHYTGMAAMRMNPAIDYDPPVVLLSIAIAALAATAALWIASTLRRPNIQFLISKRVAAALVMGLAIIGMHYTGMAAARFPVGSICGAASSISATWLAAIVTVVTLNILTITLVASKLDVRLELRTDAFTDSLRTANETLQHQTLHDALTGLPNRYLLSERIQHAIHVAEHSDLRFALYFIDIDGFKSINDSSSHAVGDELLKKLSVRLQACIRKEDVLARLSADEFVILIEKIADVTMAAEIAEKLLECFGSDFELAESRISVTSSIGISLYPDNGNTLEALLRHADAAMHEVKANGRNGYRFFEAEMNVTNLRAIEIQRGLRGAIVANQLFVQYQPKWSCVSRTMVGAEALVRWRHPELGLVSPAEFIAVAERTGQIVQIDNWVLEQVCKQISEWLSAGIRMPHIAVNLSQINFRSRALVEEIIAVVDRYRIPRGALTFEITESVAMQNAMETRETISKLQTAGFNMAIDDFGTGYSSLSYLQQFSVPQLKVDRMFINSLSPLDSKGAAVVTAIINLAHSLNMHVVAEGVETEYQLATLKAMGCDQVQGFLLARPLDSDVFLSLIRETAPTEALLA